MATDWNEIRVAYVSGDLTLRDLAKAFCVSFTMVKDASRREKWVMQREQHRQRVASESLSRIEEAKASDQMRLYDSARAAIERMIAVANRVSEDPEGFFRHAVQREQRMGQDVDKWVEDKVLETINGKNYSDVAKGLTAITSLARILDRIVEAPTQAKLDIDREKLELDRRKAGMSDDIESESGVALMPAVDQSLLDTAIDDPDQPGEAT